MRVVEVLVENGQARVLFEERAETYLEVGHNLEAPTEIIPIPATDELIWFSQRSGFAHLYDLITGEMKKAITSGQWSVSGISNDRNRAGLLVGVWYFFGFYFL